jgi:hypothetical protein
LRPSIFLSLVKEREEKIQNYKLSQGLTQLGYAFVLGWKASSKKITGWAIFKLEGICFMVYVRTVAPSYDNNYDLKSSDMFYIIVISTSLKTFQSVP